MNDGSAPQAIQLIPIDRVNVINPRVRNKRIFAEIVSNIAEIGLKRPITVTRRVDPDGVRTILSAAKGGWRPTKHAELDAGTGAAPGNGASQTGTAISGGQGAYLAAAATAPIAVSGILTGLTLNTAAWFDLAVKTNATSAAPINLNCTAFELP
jgi:hypothetical protein